ncbi:MAG: STT3 domain-containing protein [Candidatus Nanoarchaeia archaeon]|nr:STT3 domain-containing protein [Candidatus Nanoarchaeia archaeon]
MIEEVQVDHEVLDERKKKLVSKLKKNQIWIVIGLLVLIIFFGYYIRTLNIPLLKDLTTGGYITADLDPHAFLRYARYIVENGDLMTVDYMRNFPVGYSNMVEFSFLSYTIVYLYKFLNFFNPSMTIELATNLYPPIAFVFGMIFFFLLIKKLFNPKLALIASALLVIIPTYLYRTMGGVADKESLAMVFFFMSFYFYFVGFKSDKTWKIVLFGALAGIATGLLSRVWGGVNFVFMIIGLFMLFSILFFKFETKTFFLYSSWFIAMLIVTVTGKYNLYTILASFTSGIAFLAFFMGIVYYAVFERKLIKLSEKLTEKLPRGFFVAIVSLVLLVIFASVLVDPSFVVSKPHAMVNDLVNPLVDRWSKTVAESHEAYLTDTIGSYGNLITLLILFGSILLFWNFVKELKSRKYLTGAYVLFVLLISFYKYSAESVYLNGHSNIAILMVVGSFVLFFGFLIYGYINLFRKDRTEFEKIFNISKTGLFNLFVLVWFIISLLAALRAVRLLFVFSPIAAVLIAYLLYEGIAMSSKLKNNIYRGLIVIVLILLIVVPFYGYVKADINSAKNIGPVYNGQWQYAMKWVRENTPEDAVFAHWWDYGYWVQTGGKRATITDGGNAIGAWNYFMGRHVITGQNDQEALEFLYAHNASYLLMISDEIGKYPAFSSIGSDQNFDRYTQISSFSLDRSKTQETKDDVIYVYQGGTMLDEDFVLNDVLLPRFGAGIGGFLVSINVSEGGNVDFPKAPIAAVIYNNKQYNIPVNCVYFEGKTYKFEGEDLGGCLRFIPSFEGTKGDRIGALLYLSDKVVKGNFGRLYLLEEKSEAFELVYNDESLGVPLSYYNGRIIGPLKIWKINYPDNFVVNESLKELYLGSQFPDGVQ